MLRSILYASHKEDHPSLVNIGTRCENCLNRALQLCDTSHGLRDKHDQLVPLFNQPELPISTTRTLVYEINALSSAFFAAVVGVHSALKWVRDDIEALSNTWQLVRGELWWRNALAWLREGLSIVAKITMPIPEPHFQVIGKACTVGSAVAGFVHTRTEGSTMRSIGGWRIPYLPMIAGAVEKASESAEAVRALEMGLDQTIVRALYLIDHPDVWLEMSK